MLIISAGARRQASPRRGRQLKITSTRTVLSDAASSTVAIEIRRSNGNLKTPVLYETLSSAWNVYQLFVYLIRPHYESENMLNCIHYNSNSVITQDEGSQIIWELVIISFVIRDSIETCLTVNIIHKHTVALAWPKSVWFCICGAAKRARHTIIITINWLTVTCFTCLVFFRQLKINWTNWNGAAWCRAAAQTTPPLRSSTGVSDASPIKHMSQRAPHATVIAFKSPAIHTQPKHTETSRL